jgi:hypothetical protein
MTRARVRAAYVDQLEERLSSRDRAIIEAIGRVRVMTGGQIERLIFPSLAQPSRSVVRRRVLARLVSWRILTTLDRRIGGTGAGSQSLIFALDTAGQLLVRRWHGGQVADGQRIRRPWTPGRMFLTHSIEITELYVRLVEAVRVGGGFEVRTFVAEPIAWVPNGLGGWLKPDAYVVLATAAFAECTWLEVYRAGVSVPTVRRKLRAYVDFAARGQAGPDGVMPRVVITMPDEQRRSAVAECIDQLPGAPAGLFSVVVYDATIPLLTTAPLAND